MAECVFSSLVHPLLETRDRSERREGIGLIYHHCDPSGKGTSAAGLPVFLVGFLSAPHVHMHIHRSRETDICRAIESLVGLLTGAQMYNRALLYADIFDIPVRELHILKNQI
jgi:hypothetical protein